MALSSASKAPFEHLSSTEEMRENGIKVDAECFLTPIFCPAKGLIQCMEDKQNVLVLPMEP